MRSRAGIILGVAAFVLCTGFGSGERLFAPSADLWPKWQAHDAANKAVIDHGLWDRLLKKYVVKGTDGVNLFRYGDVGPTDRQTWTGTWRSYRPFPSAPTTARNRWRTGSIFTTR